MIALHGAKHVKLIKKHSDHYKDCNKTYEDWNYYLKYMEVRNKYFIFECEKCEK